MDLLNAADDFFVNINLQTTLPLPSGRETILHFCETAQKQFPAMTTFYRRETGEHGLEGDHDEGSYPWLEIHQNRLTAGFFNPPSLDDAYSLLLWLLNRSVYFLDISTLDVECFDVLYGFNLEYCGNRDQIIARALLAGSPLSALDADGAYRPIECEPNIVYALDEDCCLQARLSTETRSSAYQVRTGQYENDPISVYLTLRRMPAPSQLLQLEQAFREQSRFCEDLAERIVVPHIIQPIVAAIASAQ